MNKLTVIGLFVLLSLTPLSSFATLSEEDVMNKYANPQALQTAIDNGEVSYADLPASIQKAVHDKVIQPPMPGITFDLSNPISLLMILAVPILAIFIVLRFIAGPNHYDDDDDEKEEEETSNKTEDKVTKVSMDNVKTKEDHPMGDKTHD